MTSTALVTGGARRIGRAIVEDLAANGFSVAIHCNRSRADADALAQAVRAAGADTRVFPKDLAERGAASELFHEVTRSMGPVHLLVNSASVFEADEVGSLDWETWDRHFALHVETPVALAQALAADLPTDGEALVVNIIDQRVWRLTPRYFSYTLSKSALWTATRTLAMALAPRVRVNAIGPGPTLPNARQSGADFQAQTDALLLSRGPDLSEFGRTIRYLWEARSVTGQMIAIDGGQHLAWQTADVTGMVE
ncbi:MAG: SDR family oxidoreductase [Rhizobiaceae bacterium]